MRRFYFKNLNITGEHAKTYVEVRDTAVGIKRLTLTKRVDSVGKVLCEKFGYKLVKEEMAFRNETFLGIANEIYKVVIPISNKKS